MVAEMTRDEAVAYAVSLLREVFDRTLPRNDAERTMAEFRAYTAGYKGGVVRVEIRDLIEDAKTDKIAFDALGLIAAELVGAGRELEWPLKRWVMGVLRREISRPTRQGGFKGENYYRDIGIHLVVVEVSKKGFHATRNEASTHANSACDIVADAMRDLEKRPRSYDHIKDIFEMSTLKGF